MARKVALDVGTSLVLLSSFLFSTFSRTSFKQKLILSFLLALCFLSLNLSTNDILLISTLFQQKFAGFSA